MASGHDDSGKRDSPTGGKEVPEAKVMKQTSIGESMGIDTDPEGDSDGPEETRDQNTHNLRSRRRASPRPAENEEEDAKPESKDKKASNKKVKKEDRSHGDGKSAVNSHGEPDTPSSILEKGIIYFFIRGRVNVESPTSVEDIARSFMLLRPLPHDAKLTEGKIGDAGNIRIVVLPKKVFPKSGRDRFLSFVEKTGTSFDEIKNEFLEGANYDTKTAGKRHTPAATPAAEGVYAITSTGRESHLAYILTLPEELGEFQKDLGLKSQGSFIISTRNPETSPPAGAQIPEGPEFPKEVQEEFRNLRWLPTQPKHFDYVNAQVLLIGETSGIQKATEPQKEDQKHHKEEPLEALEHLEEEDLNRMKGLPGDQSSSIFADLEARAKDYPKLQTTF
ncbi:uncharacterized protein F5Z01DRAFT_298705 [Emericellopsis atlantica]|uniref:BTB domain transcription factor n=1 Tax=Emericellopsis atlantica TaxID=2614577 RepID=A0A9P7ZFI9_9HYPO|nr:uncharacterized protein F5Z01DRAFT_298705 [Emericellopsis atlantica]KAG9251183.1 hypothetical protein F5Z01DRAFT_298705 [Emericellopsis atlantica]